MSVANWSKSDLLLILVTFDSTWWHVITADLPMNLQARLYLCSSCGSWVMLQIVLKRQFFIKRPLSHQLLSCFLKCTNCITLMFKTYNNNRLNHYTKRRQSIFSGWTTIGGMSYLKHKRFYHPSPVWPIIPLAVIALVTFDIGLYVVKT